MSAERVLTFQTGAGEPPSDEAAVARIVTRLSAEYVLNVLQLLIDTHGDIRSGLLMAAINTTNVAHIDGRTEEGRRAAASDGLVRDDVREPVSIARLAEATGLPQETIRRAVRPLIDAGICVQVNGGVIVPRAFLERPEIARAVTANLRYVSEFVRKLLVFGLVEEASGQAPAWPVTGGHGAEARGVARFTEDYIVEAFQLLVDTYGDIRAGIVAQAIVTANTVHLEAPMGEGWRYAGLDQPPPDEARRPISVSALARLLGLPYETLRQQVGRLIESGACVRVDGGLIVPRAVVEQPAAERAMLANVHYVRKFVRNLWSIGFDAYEP